MASLVVCVFVRCMWGVVGAKKLVMCWVSFFLKTRVQHPHKLLDFEMFSNALARQVCDWEN